MRIICFLNLLLFTLFSYAQNDSNSNFKITGSFAVDENSSWKTTEIASKKFYPFPESQNLNIGFNKNTAVWCFFKIKNPNDFEKTQWLCFNNNHLDSIVFFDKNKKIIIGDRTSGVSPFIESQAFEIRLKPNEEKEFYVMVKKGISFFEFSYCLEDENLLRERSSIKIALVSFFFGIIFLLICFNGILFYFTRKKMYMYYIFYSVLSIIYISISSYYAKFMLFHEFIYFSELRIYTASFWLIALSIFLCHYLEMKKLKPVLYKTIYYLNITNVSIVVITIINLFINALDNVRIFFTLGYINFIVIIVFIMWSAITTFKTDRSSSIYVLFAFLPQSVWALAIMLKSFGMIPKNLPEDALVYISLYEVLLFGYVLTKNYIETFQKNNELMREIILEKENSLKSITQTQIRERRNIANIIHDNFGSKIAYILQLLQLKNIMLANENIKELATEIREISHQILPKSLDDGALIPSLKSQINTWNSGLTQSKIELFTFDFPEKINEAWIYDIYLITTEIINNSIKHGRAASVNIELYGYNEEYIFQFTDDGIGFDTKKIAKGFGLENIEKRILYYKGTFEINSSENEGTVIQINIPKS